MTLAADTLCTAFAGHRLVASGPLAEVALKAKALVDAESVDTILVFEDETGQQAPLDLRGSAAQVAARLGIPRRRAYDAVLARRANP